MKRDFNLPNFYLGDIFMKLFSKVSFLSPALGKIVLDIVLFYIFGWIIKPMTIFGTDWYPVGFPFTVYAEGFCLPDYVCVEFRWIAFIVNLIIWYMVSAFIIHKRTRFWVFCLCFIGLVLAMVFLNNLFLFL
jgi:hypothetical protein